MYYKAVMSRINATTCRKNVLSQMNSMQIRKQLENLTFLFVWGRLLERNGLLALVKWEMAIGGCFTKYRKLIVPLLHGTVPRHSQLLGSYRVQVHFHHLRRRQWIH